MSALGQKQTFAAQSLPRSEGYELLALAAVKKSATTH